MNLQKKNSEISVGIRLSMGDSAKSLPLSPFKLFQLKSTMTMIQTEIENLRLSNFRMLIIFFQILNINQLPLI